MECTDCGETRLTSHAQVGGWSDKKARDNSKFPCFETLAPQAVQKPFTRKRLVTLSLLLILMIA